MVSRPASIACKIHNNCVFLVEIISEKNREVHRGTCNRRRRRLCWWTGSGCRAEGTTDVLLAQFLRFRCIEHIECLLNETVNTSDRCLHSDGSSTDRTCRQVAIQRYGLLLPLVDTGLAEQVSAVQADRLGEQVTANGTLEMTFKDFVHHYFSLKEKVES